MLQHRNRSARSRNKAPMPRHVCCPACAGERFVWKRFMKWEWLARCGECRGRGTVAEVLLPAAKPAVARKPARETAGPELFQAAPAE